VRVLIPFYRPRAEVFLSPTKDFLALMAAIAADAIQLFIKQLN
jgi:hypothetical protein